MSDQANSDTRAGFIVIGCSVTWALVVVWVSYWAWSYLPPMRDHWWGFPALVTNIALVPAPIFIFAALDAIFKWSD